MQRSRALIFAWILLLVPTLVVGALALRSVMFEQQRLERQDEQSARERLQAIAENLSLAIGDMREGLLESLAGIPAANRIEQLDRWRLGNPLIRNVFVWQSGRGLLFPDPERPASDEEQDFVRRYEALFVERLPWEQPLQDPSASAPVKSSYMSARSELRELSKAAPQAADLAAAPELPHWQRGWRPWFWENRLYLLGWVASPDGRQRYGLEVEMMALLSRLVESLPDDASPEVYALLDDRGEIFFQGAGGELASTLTPLLTQPVGRDLPHWQVAVYLPAGAAGQGHGVALFGSLLVASFVVAILFGGGLMLWETRRHARDALRKTNFVGNVSHELKTPLTTIRMYTELLQENLDPEARSQRYLEVIESECQRLTRLVNNVLDFGRLEQGRKRYNRESFDVNQLVAELLERHRRRVEGAGMELRVELAQDGPLLEWDRDALEQTLLNLLDNALKYAQEGKWLLVRTAKEGARVTIRVCDRGPGVPAAQREKIFDKFHRVDDSLAARHPGSGLGLSIARQLMRDQGGDLRYLPQQSGSCFEIELPGQGETP